MAQLTPGEMVAPKAIAPYEVALAFKLWQERWDEYRASIPDDESWEATVDDVDGLGPPYRLTSERPTEYGERVAAALFTLIKEI